MRTMCLNCIYSMDTRTDLLQRCEPCEYKHQAGLAIEGYKDRIAKLEAEAELYREALTIACEAVTDWGAYASEYFQDKWDWKVDCEPATHLQTARDNLAVRATNCLEAM